MALGCSALKPEQMQVITEALRGPDVFAGLPTGFGKTLVTLLPAAFDYLNPGGPPSIVLVVSPLTAIMKDQTVREIGRLRQLVCHMPPTLFSTE